MIDSRCRKPSHFEPFKRGYLYPRNSHYIFGVFLELWFLGYHLYHFSRAEHRRKTSFPYDTIATVSWSQLPELGNHRVVSDFFFSVEMCCQEMTGTFLREIWCFFVGGKKYNRVPTKTKNKLRTATMLLDLCQLTWLEACLSLIWEIRQDKLAWHW